MARFGIAVKKHWSFSSEHGKSMEDGTWDVFLPHKCGQWSIAGDDDGYDDGATYESAVAELEAFIAEAKRALESLRSKKEFGDD